MEASRAGGDGEGTGSRAATGGGIASDRLGSRIMVTAVVCAFPDSWGHPLPEWTLVCCVLTPTRHSGLHNDTQHVAVQTE